MLRPGAKWALAGVVLLGLYLSSEGSRTYWKRKQRLEQLDQKLAGLKNSNEKLSQEIDRLKSDPRSIEKIARTELGLIKPGEIEYRFVVDRSSASGKRK